jgi:hypothetical protein
MNTQGTRDITKFEDRLEAIIRKVEESGWPDADKEVLYAQISQYLRSVILPIIVKYTPEAELKALSADTSKVSVDAFVALMKQPFGNPKMYEELNAMFHTVLDDVDTALTKGGIV